MIVLIGTNCDSGKTVEVGLYEDIEAARFYVSRNCGRGVVFSVWTPSVGETIKVPAVTGLSLPPERP